MKKIILGAIIGFMIAGLFAFKNTKTPTDDNKGLGKVLVIDGKYVFTNADPVQAYETAFTYDVKPASGWTGCPTIEEMAKNSLTNAQKKGLPFDAVIVGSSKTNLAIKFK